MNKAQKEIIIIGGGGFALEVYSYIKDDNSYIVKGVIDESKNCELLKKNKDLIYLGDFTDYMPNKGDIGLICIGNAIIRRKLYFEAERKNLKLSSFIHSSSHVSSDASIGKGVLIGPHCIVSSHAVINDNVALNVFCGVGHGAEIKNHSVMSPYSVINGDCILGEAVFLGSRVTLNPKVKIDDFSLIDAGSIIRENIPAFSLVSQRVDQTILDNRILRKQLLEEL